QAAALSGRPCPAPPLAEPGGPHHRPQDRRRLQSPLAADGLGSRPASAESASASAGGRQRSRRSSGPPTPAASLEACGSWSDLLGSEPRRWRSRLEEDVRQRHADLLLSAWSHLSA
ncbi:unnamed protein product, partial [Prorocentrum cordatum]